MIPCTSCGRLRPHSDSPCPHCADNRVGTQERLDFQPDAQKQLVEGGAAAPNVHFAAPAPTSDPFEFSPDVTETLEPPSQDELDAAADLRAKRDRANAKRKKTRQTKSDLESRTRELLRSMGYVYARTEHYSWSGRKSDLFGFVDGVAVGEHDVLFVQTCARSDRAAHVKKMAAGTFSMGGGSDYSRREVSDRLVSKVDVRLALVLWDQPGGPGTKWRHEIELVSRETLHECDARARKRGAA